MESSFQKIFSIVICKGNSGRNKYTFKADTIVIKKSVSKQDMQLSFHLERWDGL